MSAVSQVYYASFDAVFLKLPLALRGRVEARMEFAGADDMDGKPGG